MNRKINTIIFLVTATLLNVSLLIVISALLLFIAGLVFSNLNMQNNTAIYAVVAVILIGSIAGSLILYTKIIKWAMKKWKLEERIHPVFGNKSR